VDAIPCPASFVGKTLRDLDLRRKQGVMIVGVRRSGTDRSETARTTPEPDMPLEADMVLVATGPLDRVRALRDAADTEPAGNRTPA